MAPTRSLSARPGVAQSSLARYWTTTHAPEYLGFVVLLVIWVMTFLFIKPFHRMFFINDMAIAFPHAEHERVTVAMSFVYSLFVPLIILVAYNFISRSSAAKHEVTYLSFGISVVMSGVITDIIKNGVGRPRPDLLARCQPAENTKPNVLVTIDVCTREDGHVLQDGWRSFPSGHSSFAFAGLGFLSLFIAGQFHVFRYSTGGRDLSRTLLFLAPLVGAAMIAISRCEDYRHDVYDVCTGSLLGMTVAYWSYRRHWPGLSSPSSDEPHPAPGQDNSQLGWHRVRDTEETAADAGYELRQVRGEPS
ncbi:PAP2 superfamily protein [Sarocladium implicatum]|nr:PAP2 superfamily protein [Sarocladium implicatum]